MGREEIDVIAPASRSCARGGSTLAARIPADTMFHAAARARYDVAHLPDP